MDTPTQPQNYSPLPNTVASAAAGAPAPKKPSVLVIILALLAVVLVGLVGFMVYRNSMNAQTPSTTVSPTAVPVTPTPTGEISQDDSVGVMDEEVDNTTVDDFSSDDKIIESDTNKL